MKLRKTYITDSETITETKTEDYPLDFTDPVRAIVVGFRGQRYDNTDTNDPQILEDIDKIEVCDGSDVLFSCTGTEAGANQLAHTGTRPHMAYTANSNGVNRSQVKILFGKNLSDDEYGLDCEQFDNPKIKITHSFTEGSTGQWASNQQSMTIEALVAEGAAKPSKFFMTKEIDSFTKATSGDKTIQMPRDYPYRYVLIQVKNAETPVYAELSNVKISCNYDEFVPLNETTIDLAMDNIGKYGLQHVQYEAIGDGSDEDIKAYSQMSNNWGGWVNSWNFGQNAVLKRPYSGYSTIGRNTTGASSGEDFTSTYLENAQRAIVTHMGWELFETEILPFGNLQEEEEWFDSTAWKSVRLILTQAQTDALETNIVLQQPRPYA